MAKSSNISMKAVGLALFVVGVGLIFWGYQMSGSLASELSKSISGSVPDEVMYRYIGGAACAVVGFFLLGKR